VIVTSILAYLEFSLLITKKNVLKHCSVIVLIWVFLGDNRGLTLKWSTFRCSKQVSFCLLSMKLLCSYGHRINHCKAKFFIRLVSDCLYLGIPRISKESVIGA
jgi:hypothetical protein